MSNTLARSKAAASLILLGAVMSNGKADAGLIQNGDFQQIGPKGNGVTNSSPPPPGGSKSGPSAADSWRQYVVHPNSYLETQVVPIEAGSGHALQVTTNAGYVPAKDKGNGVKQSFPPTQCVTASFWILVDSGEVTGGLIRTSTSRFAASPHFKHTNAGTWHFYSQYSRDNVSAIAFENSQPSGAKYSVRDVVVQNYPCPNPPVVFKDMGKYLAYDPFSRIKDPGGPVEKIRITNKGAVALDGPFQVVLEGLPEGRTVLNPDGDHMGTPFLALTSRSLAPGASEVISVQFNGGLDADVPQFRVKVGSFEAR